MCFLFIQHFIKHLWFLPYTSPFTCTALSLLLISMLWDEWECLYEILTGHWLLCSRTQCWPCVSGSSLRPSVGDGHQGGFQEGALSHMQASPESSIALGTDALDLLGDRALKLSKLPNHCSRCYKGYCYVNAATYYQAQGEPQSLCHFWGDDFSAVFVLFM